MFIRYVAGSIYIQVFHNTCDTLDDKTTSGLLKYFKDYKIML